MLSRISCIAIVGFLVIPLATSHSFLRRAGRGSGIENSEAAPSALVTTAYWNIRSKRGDSNQSDSVYRHCMKDVLSLQAPMVIYGSDESLQEMSRVRGAANPPLVGQVQLSIGDLPPCSTHPELSMHAAKYTNRWDVPTVELGCIWDGKPSLLEKSSVDHPEYDWYAWLDVCMGHGEITFAHGDEHWPNPEKMKALPQDKIAVSLSNANSCESCRDGWKYCHCLAGTAFVVPRSLVTPLASNFSSKVDECLAAFSETDEGAYACLSDQVILTKLFLDSPDLFYIGSSGYGSVATEELT